MDPSEAVTAPIVAGAADDEEADRLVSAAAELGAAVVARRPAGRGGWLLQLAPAAALLPSPHLVIEGIAGDSGPEDQVSAGVVTALRAAGFAALAGPPTPAHATVWARRNAPSWFVPGVAGVCFPWSPCNRATAPLLVEIDPGAGFGAGGHPTTLGLLAGLADPTVTGAPSGPHGLADLSGLRVLDVGCGTGVLAIAAARCGAGPVDALDIAPAALEATRANAARNGVAHRVRLVDADLARCPGPYDLVLANIHAEVLVDLAPELRRLVAAPRLDRPGQRGGLLGVSGLSVAQVSRLEAAFTPLRTVHRHHRDDWVSVWFRW